MLLEQVFKKNSQSVKIVFKNFPLKNHPEARPAALAALAANRQGRFWEYHDKLFQEKMIEQSDYERIATELDLDLNTFRKDMQSAKLKELIQSDMLEAEKIGVTVTPTIFINGRKLRQRSMEGFQNMIDEELDKLD